jgi:hypothetical protein
MTLRSICPTCFLHLQFLPCQMRLRSSSRRSLTHPVALDRRLDPCILLPPAPPRLRLHPLPLSITRHKLRLLSSHRSLRSRHSNIPPVPGSHYCSLRLGWPNMFLPTHSTCLSGYFEIFLSGAPSIRQRLYKPELDVLCYHFSWTNNSTTFIRVQILDIYI